MVKLIIVKLYKHILFDLDHTLWDFERNSSEALLEVYNLFNLAHFDNFGSSLFVSQFKEVNANLWDLYNHDKIDQEYLRNERFKIVLTDLGLKPEEVPENIGEVYLQICPTKGNVIPFAFEILNYLKGKYQLHIITNGFEDVQDTKLKSSNLKDYFEKVITSERVGFKKPSKEMFNKAIEWIGGDKNEFLMIGDNIDTDIQGALNAEIDVVYFNPESIPHELEVTYEVSSLNEIMSIL